MAEADQALATGAAELIEMLGALWGFATLASRSRGGLPALPPAQARALGLIITHGSSTPTALAAQLRLSRPMVSETIRRLEESNLVERRRSRSDGRSVVITATDRGHYVQRSFRLGLVSSVAEAFTAMTHGDVRQVMECMPSLASLHEQLSSIAEREESAVTHRARRRATSAPDGQP